MKLSGRTVFLGIAVAFCLGASASAATIKILPGKHGGVIIQLYGKITSGDADAFISQVKQANDSGKAVENVELNSAGGKLIEGLRLAEAIKAGKISTAVGPRAVCASACFLAFAAGDQKFVGEGALIGVHKASENGSRETELSGAVTVSMARFAKELGVPSAILRRMVTTSPKQIAWLDSQDLRSMGVMMAGMPPQTRQVATEQVPEELASLATLAPGARASTSSPSWNEFVDKVAKLSAEQNDGHPVLSRLCQPEFNNCVLGVAYALKDGRQGMAVVIQDEHGKSVRREVCEFNNANDARNCVDWDSGARHRDVKDKKGDWVNALANDLRDELKNPRR
jgi:hypothetical protein